MQPRRVAAITVSQRVAQEKRSNMGELVGNFSHISHLYMLEEFLTLSALGPVVQSIVSLTSLLRVISLTILADSVYNILIFFAEKM